MVYPSKFVDKVSSIPEDTQYLVMYNDSYTSDNGYPEDGCTRYSYIRTVSFNSKELMLEWINSETSPRQWGGSRDPREILIVPIETVKRIKVETTVQL